MRKIVGIDEVGRGCLAGPLVAAAVVLDREIDSIKDSKQLSKKQRLELNMQVYDSCLSLGLGWVTAGEVDKLGLTAATVTAMRRALGNVTCEYDEIIIDGSINYLAQNPKSKAIIKADQTVSAVSAASIVAKVSRDRYMYNMSTKYPGYGFEKHVGYGTKQHIEMLDSYGPCALHRLSFAPLRKLLVTDY